MDAIHVESNLDGIQVQQRKWYIDRLTPDINIDIKTEVPVKLNGYSEVSGTFTKS